MKLEDAGPVFPALGEKSSEFSSTESDINAWQLHAIEAGQAWIAQSTEHEFQPQGITLTSTRRRSLR